MYGQPAANEASGSNQATDIIPTLMGHLLATQEELELCRNMAESIFAQLYGVRPTEPRDGSKSSSAPSCLEEVISDTRRNVPRLTETLRAISNRL